MYLLEGDMWSVGNNFHTEIRISVCCTAGANITIAASAAAASAVVTE
jgi:hypothetical protein